MIQSNVESKIRHAQLREVAERAARAGARYDGSLHQVDTYFHVATGRLKLREVSLRGPDGETSMGWEVIRYDRPSEAGARVSAYERATVVDPEDVRAGLVAEHGVRGVVEKQRELWILGATRIHLDSVVGLGDFVELETVAPAVPGASERAEHDHVFSTLGLDPAATVEGSYIDLATAPGARD